MRGQRFSVRLETLARLAPAVWMRRSPATLGAVALFLAVTLLGLMASGILWDGFGAASAAGGGPEMSLSAHGPNVTCDSQPSTNKGDVPKPAKCAVAIGTQFTLSISANVIPTGGYTFMQTFIDYGSTLIYKQQSIAAEIVWPDEDTNVRAQLGPGLVNHGSLTGLLPPLPVSGHVGNLVELLFTCSAGTSDTTIALLPEGDSVALTNGAQFKDADGTPFIPKVDSLMINCVIPPTPPPTKMAVSVEGGDCNASQQTTKCNVLVGGQFTLSIDAITAPQGGYIGFQTFINYGSDLIYTAQSAGTEIVWPGAAAQVRGELAAGLVHHGALTGEQPPLPLSSYTGSLVELAFTCSANESETTILVLPDGHPTALTSGTKFIPPPSGSIIPILNSVTINCVGPEETVTEPIDNSGGTMTTGNTDALEVELEVLLGSIPVETGEVQITVSAFISQVLPVGDADTLSRGFRFEPSGLQFQEPYPRVTISYTDDEVAGLDESKIDVMVCDSLGENCELAVVESRNTVLNTITIILQHFSDVILCRTDDCDGDGCTNTAEEGSDERVGGLRNMRNRSDYYDINDDQIIDLSNDIFEVIQHYWPDNRAAPNGPGQYPSGYDVFDRGPSPGPNAWDMTDPDGVIDLSNDILGVILQYFHDCRTP